MKAYFVLWSEVNPYVTNGLFHSYHFDESILIFRDIRRMLSFLCHISMKILSANSRALD